MSERPYGLSDLYVFFQWEYCTDVTVQTLKGLGYHISYRRDYVSREKHHRVFFLPFSTIAEFNIVVSFNTII